MVKSLYDICIQYLVDNSEFITDLEGVPYNPYISDLMNSLFSSRGKRLTSNILNVIGTSQGEGLRKDKKYGTIELTKHAFAFNQTNALHYIANWLPRFVCRLNLSHTNINDNDILLISGLTNLSVLDLSYTYVGDQGVGHLCRMADESRSGGCVRISFLEMLSLAGNDGVSDACLLNLPNIKSLTALDLSYTQVTNVATVVLSRTGYTLGNVCTESSTEVIPMIIWESSLWWNKANPGTDISLHENVIGRHSDVSAYLSRRLKGINLNIGTNRMTDRSQRQLNGESMVYTRSKESIAKQRLKETVKKPVIQPVNTTAKVPWSSSFFDMIQNDLAGPNTLETLGTNVFL
ncbi:hypothetical protein CLU79DRAFT_729954 [Phycomyces nitens]|nr:hypothetical protein CLU79DRAFT_729954 [Phycomyces nitens]